MAGIIPAPASFALTGGEPFTLTAEPGWWSTATVRSRSPRRSPHRYVPPPDSPCPSSKARPGHPTSHWSSPRARSDGTTEGYTLESGTDGVRIGADTAAGLFWGTQSLRHLLPAETGRSDDATRQQGGWAVPAASVADQPRFAYRGAMLDVARHFFSVDDVQRYIDAHRAAQDQLPAPAPHRRPGLAHPDRRVAPAHERRRRDSAAATAAASTRRPTTARIVDYAAERYITIVPEIDMPGHTNAALSAYPELNCDGVAPRRTPASRSASARCRLTRTSEVTYRFLEDVFGEVAAITPGPYLHVGGDESLATSPDDYLDLARRITAAAAATGKTVIGWHEMGASRELPAGTVGQYWDFLVPRDETAELTRSFVEQGGRIILSPADVAYLDMQYPDDPVSPLGNRPGQQWADGPPRSRRPTAGSRPRSSPARRRRDPRHRGADLDRDHLDDGRRLEFMVVPPSRRGRRDRLVAGTGRRCRSRQRGVLREGRAVRRASRRDGGRLPPGARGGLARLAGWRASARSPTAHRSRDARWGLPADGTPG